MNRKRRTPNPRLLREKRPYSFIEIADLLSIHVRTVQRWRKEGMRVLDNTTKPYLIMGADVQTFIREHIRKRKKPLQLGEFFCARCQEQRKSLANKLIAQHTIQSLGKQHKQVILRGICEVCETRLTRFSSDRQLKKMKQLGLTVAEHPAVLKGSESCCGNADIRGGS